MSEIIGPYTSCHILSTCVGLCSTMTGSSHVFGTYLSADSVLCDFIEIFSKFRRMNAALPTDLPVNVHALRHCRAAHQVSY